MNISKIHEQLLAGIITVDDLSKFKPEFKKFLAKIRESATSKDAPVIEEALMMCNDYYTSSPDGDVLITDKEYDDMTRIYKFVSGKSQVIYTDSKLNFNEKRWEERKHIAPNMVGSIEKIYGIDYLYDYIVNKYREKHIQGILLSPKYDGCSVVISFDEQFNIIAALTRKDGIYGQDITPLIKRCNLSQCITALREANLSGKTHVKCELLVSTKDFEKLKEEKSYKNRRAAASAISANPVNIEYAKYLTVMPLVACCQNDITKKALLYHDTLDISNAEIQSLSLIDTVVSMYRKKITGKDFRTDGIVVTILTDDNTGYAKDIMCDSVALKFNTQVAETTIVGAYLSIGRTGKATPMIRVEPCEVNETEVTDVSLSNFNKVNSLDLHIGDRIEIESAGDVIPMVKRVMLRQKTNPLKYDDICPHCGHILRPKINSRPTAVNTNFDLYCINPDCIRVISGRISNFLDKMGAKGISDGVISNLTELLGIKKFYELFELTPGTLVHQPGWGVQSESELLRELNRIREESNYYSRFLGALGIPLVSQEKCKCIMKDIDYDTLMQRLRENPDGLVQRINAIDGFGYALAKNVVDYLSSNLDEIVKTEAMLNLKQDPSGNTENVVMSGFRDESLIDKIRSLGYEYSESFNKNTIAVISTTASSGKAQKAVKKGLPLFTSYEEDALLEYLENHSN